jgi:tetratricopeptide (TPR) repeat protein
MGQADRPVSGSSIWQADMTHPTRLILSFKPIIMAASLLVASCALSTASKAQGGDENLRPSVVVLLPIAVDESIAARGLDSDTVTAAVRFVLTMEPDLQIVTADKAPSMIAEAQLSGAVQNLQDRWIWTGDLRLPNKPAPSKLGPVTLYNGKTGRPEALREIAILVNRSVRQEATSPRSIAIHIACLNTTHARASEVAQDFRLVLETILKSEPLLSVVADSGECKTKAQVNIAADSYNASVGGSVTYAKGVMDIQPALSWRFRDASTAALVVPLPRFRGSNSDYASQRRAYIDSVARAISANTAGSCPWNHLIRGHDAMARSSASRAQIGAEMLKAGTCPFVALALLQRVRDPLDAEVLYALGQAYRATGATEFALQSFQKAVVAKPEWAEARRELASTLFDLRRYTQALEEFETAAKNNLPDIHARYAQAAYLIGKRDKAEEQVELAIEGDKQGSNPAIRHLAAQLATEKARREKADPKPYLDRALSHVEYGLNHTSDKRAFVRAAKDLAVVSMSLGNEGSNRIAQQALDLVLKSFPDDAEAYLIRGRLFIQGKQRDLAIADFDEASRISRPSLNAAAPELRVIDVELSEAHFLANNWQAARNIAKQFLSRRENSEDDGTKSYEPVAQLLIAAANIMEPEIKPQDYGGIQVQPHQPVDTIKPDQPWPALTLTIPTGVETQTIPVAVWGFQNFDAHACSLSAEERDQIRNLSRTLQEALLVPPGGTEKPLIAPCPPATNLRDPG